MKELRVERESNGESFLGFFLKVCLNERARKRPFKLAFFSSNPSLVVINGVSDRGNVC